MAAGNRALFVSGLGASPLASTRVTGPKTCRDRRGPAPSWDTAWLNIPPTDTRSIGLVAVLVAVSVGLGGVMNTFFCARCACVFVFVCRCIGVGDTVWVELCGVRNTVWVISWCGVINTFCFELCGVGNTV